MSSAMLCALRHHLIYKSYAGAVNWINLLQLLACSAHYIERNVNISDVISEVCKTWFVPPFVRGCLWIEARNFPQYSDVISEKVARRGNLVAKVPGIGRMYNSIKIPTSTFVWIELISKGVDVILLPELIMGRFYRSKVTKYKVEGKLSSQSRVFFNIVSTFCLTLV